MYYNLICIFICTPMWTKNFILIKSGCYIASHQLSGPTTDWWDAYVEAHEEPESINWLEFRAAFCAHYVSEGVIKLKKEFQDLK
jgi:hypothetical protein